MGKKSNSERIEQDANFIRWKAEQIKGSPLMKGDVIELPNGKEIKI